MRLSWAVSLGRGSRDTPFLGRPRSAHIRGSDLGWVFAQNEVDQLVALRVRLRRL